MLLRKDLVTPFLIYHAQSLYHLSLKSIYPYIHPKSFEPDALLGNGDIMTDPGEKN